MIKISACIIVKNEEKNVARCLESIRDVMDEIVVVDQDSQDSTVDICRAYTDRLYNYEWKGDFADKRNFACQKAKNDWILSIDADEILTEDLKDEFRKIDDETNFSAFVTPTMNTIFGELELLEPDKIRLFRKSHARWVGAVHESLLIDGTVGRLKGLLVHPAHPTIGSFVRKIDFYTDIEARTRSEKAQEPPDISSMAKLTYDQFRLSYNGGRRSIGPGVYVFIWAVMVGFYYFTISAKMYDEWFRSKRDSIVKADQQSPESWRHYRYVAKYSTEGRTPSSSTDARVWPSERQLEAVYSSWSWRLTSPLRAIGTILRVSRVPLLLSFSGRLVKRTSVKSFTLVHPR